MEEPRLDSRDMLTRPCSHCEAIINDLINEKDEMYEFVVEDEEFNEEDVE